MILFLVSFVRMADGFVFNDAIAATCCGYGIDEFTVSAIQLSFLF